MQVSQNVFTGPLHPLPDSAGQYRTVSDSIGQYRTVYWTAQRTPPDMDTHSPVQNEPDTHRTDTGHSFRHIGQHFGQCSGHERTLNWTFTGHSPDITGHSGHHRTCFSGQCRTLNRTLTGQSPDSHRTASDTDRTVRRSRMSKMSNLRPDRPDTHRTVPDSTGQSHTTHRPVTGMLQNPS